MLVLSRKKNESITISDEIEITVLEIRGNSVKLGIRAPGSYRILRAEISPFDPPKPEPNPA